MAKAGFNFPVLVINDLRGGRNGYDPPSSIPDIQVVEARNIDWSRATLGSKRTGSTAFTYTGPVAGILTFLARFVPGSDETAAEIWTRSTPVVASTNLFRLKPSVGAWQTITHALGDNINSTVIDHVTFNGKFFLTFDSAPSRLHVFDPADAALNWRRVGLVQPAVPTAGALAAGAVTDTRTYKVAWTRQVGGVTVRRGERSLATAPVVMAAQQVPITRPTLPGEGETHWELYAASTNGLYGLIATTAIATAAINDNNATLTAFTGTAIPLEGINLPFPNVRYLSTDGNRLLGAGDMDLLNTGNQNRVYWTPVLHDNDIGDDERWVNNVQQKNYIDINPLDDGTITALSLPLQGNLYVFKQREIFKLTPTGDVAAPYQSTELTSAIGCIAHRTLKLGEDPSGRPALYFASYQGPYRLGVNGLEYLGRDIEDLWQTLQLQSASAFHAVFYPRSKQYWLWVISTPGGTYPDLILVLNTLRSVSTELGTRGGWSVYTGQLAKATDSMLFGEGYALGNSSVSNPNLVPWITGSLANDLMAYHSTSAETDYTAVGGAAAYQAYLTTKAYAPAGEGIRFRVRAPVLHAEARAASTILTLTISRDYGLEAISQTVDLVKAASESRVIKLFDHGLAECQAIQVTLGDSAALAQSWSLDKLLLPFEVEAEAGGV